MEIRRRCDHCRVERGFHYECWREMEPSLYPPYWDAIVLFRCEQCGETWGKFTWRLNAAIFEVGAHAVDDLHIRATS